jgi:uncharacterized membrane protein YphA (DoxX/SURF4 family)
MKQKIIDLLTSFPVQMVCGIILGGVFIYASLDKIAHPRAFADIIYNYKLLPGIVIYLAACTMPWLEMTAGLCTVTGLFRRTAAMVLGGMLLLFIVAISINLARGLDFDCGCFTTIKSENGSNPVGLLIRDFFLLIPAVIIIFFSRKKATAKPS